MFQERSILLPKSSQHGGLQAVIKSGLRWYILKMINHFLVFHNVLFSLDPYLLWLMYLGWLMPHLPCYTLIQGLCFIRLPIVIANKLTMQPHKPCHAGCCQHQLSIRKQQFWASIYLVPSVLTSHSAIGAANAHFFIGMGWENERRLINAFKGSYWISKPLKGTTDTNRQLQLVGIQNNNKRAS